MERDEYLPRNNEDFDECRKLWLIKTLRVDPHAGDDVMHNLRTIDVTYAYDLGYRQALLAIRLEIDRRLGQIEFPATDTPNADIEKIKEMVNHTFNGGIRQCIKRKIEDSYTYVVGSSGNDELRKERRAYCQRMAAQKNWWPME